MPFHDWSRVGPGIFHDFQGKWISAISSTLIQEVLPPDYYTVTESYAGEMIADVLTLQAEDYGSRGGAAEHPGATAVAVSRPRVRVVETAEEGAYLAKQRRVVVRHSSNDHIVALIEIVSPGNKVGQDAISLFVRKAVRALETGWHLLIVERQPPSPRDPEGIHGVIWPEVGGNASYHAPPDKPLTLASYEASLPKHAYVEPVAVGDVLKDMPVFLAPGWYVNVPLEATHQVAWRGVPWLWRDVLEPTR
jgi:hypothetical protein